MPRRHRRQVDRRAAARAAAALHRTPQAPSQRANSTPYASSTTPSSTTPFAVHALDRRMDPLLNLLRPLTRSDLRAVGFAHIEHVGNARSLRVDLGHPD